MKNSSSPRILVAPLDWGLGHTTRCIPLIKSLQMQGAEVLVAANPVQQKLLEAECEQLTFVPFEGYNVSYPKSGNMVWSMLKQSPGIFKTIKKEHAALQDLIDERQIDAVISDNRFGLYSKKVPCVYITHQIHIQAPAFGGTLYKAHKKYIDKFDACWVPDFAGTPNLSGALSHGDKQPENLQFIGPLSRFYKGPDVVQDIDVLVMLSGPEPQRTFFESLLVDQIKALSDKKVALLRGLPNGGPALDLPDHIVFDHLPSIALGELLWRAKRAVCRPGYSTLMDLAVFGTPALLIPTPGQTEQEYLAQFHSAQGTHISQSQKAADISKVFDLEPQSGIELRSNHVALDQAVVALLQKCLR